MKRDGRMSEEVIIMISSGDTITNKKDIKQSDSIIFVRLYILIRFCQKKRITVLLSFLFISFSF